MSPLYKGQATLDASLVHGIPTGVTIVMVFMMAGLALIIGCLSISCKLSFVVPCSYVL